MYICCGKAPPFEFAESERLWYNGRVKEEAYTLIRSKRKTIGLKVLEDGSVVVRAPRLCPASLIDDFVRSSSGFIEKQRAKLDKLSAEAGKEGALSEEEIKRLANEMKALLPEKLERYSKLLGVTRGRVTVRCQKTKWGSCTAEGNLSFNCLLMLAPEGVLDYVIVHELCHRRHMDHSKAFWAEVGRIFPDYKERRRWLREKGGALLLRARLGKGE